MSKQIKASDCKCVECGEPAVAFWPMVDPDIPSHPWCRKCLDEAQLDLLIKMQEEGLIGGFTHER